MANQKSIKNYTTQITVAKTAGEITTLLARRGVQQTSQIFDEAGAPVALRFVIATDYGPREYQLPIRVDGVLKAIEQDSNIPRAQRTRERAAKIAWRIAKDWVEAQLALADAELASVDEVFLPYLVGEGGATLYELFRERQLAIAAAE